MPRKYLLTFILLLLIKVFVSLGFIDFQKLNIDEDLNYTIALRHNTGLGYTMVVNNKSTPTAFHGSGSIFLYSFLLKQHISKEAFAIFWFILTHIVFLFSLVWVFRLANFFLDKEYSFVTALIYGIFPPTLYFIGALFTYESICTYLLIYFVLVLITLYRNGAIKSYNYILLPLLACISCLLRGQLLAFYIPAFLMLIILSITKPPLKPGLIISISGLILITLVHIPILKKNKAIFNAPILSTQFGFELLQGHSPVARGSWQGNFNKKGNVLYEYAHANIPGIDTLNEYNESLARKKVAVNWLRSNIAGELKLTMRKMAIYFLPQNYEVLPGYSFYNPLNLLIYLLFLFSFCSILLKNHKLPTDLFILFLPIGFSIAISIIFFVGYRWRFYAEPFMIIFAVLYVQKMVARFRSTRMTPIRQ